MLDKFWSESQLYAKFSFKAWFAYPTVWLLMVYICIFMIYRFRLNSEIKSPAKVQHYIMNMDKWSKHWANGQNTGQMGKTLDKWSKHWKNWQNTGKMYKTLEKWAKPWTNGRNTGQMGETLDKWVKHRTNGWNTGQMGKTLDKWAKPWTNWQNPGQMDKTLDKTLEQWTLDIEGLFTTTCCVHVSTHCVCMQTHACQGTLLINSRDQSWHLLKFLWRSDFIWLKKLRCINQ